MLTKVYDAEPVSYDEILADYIKYAEALKPYVTDTNAAVLKAVKEDKKGIIRRCSSYYARP